MVYYYMVQDFAPFTVGCFGPVKSVDDCRALYPTCNDGDEILLKTADGTRWYDRDCPCFHGEWMKSGWLGEQLRLQIADQPSHPDQAFLVAYDGLEFRTWGGAGPDWEGTVTGDCPGALIPETEFITLILQTPKLARASDPGAEALGSSPLPSYHADGGPEGNGHVSFLGNQWVEAGQQTFNFATNGGLSIVTVMRFTSAGRWWERIIDFSNGQANNQIRFARVRDYSQLSIEIYNGGSRVCDFRTALGTVEQDTWMRIVLRHRADTRALVLSINDVEVVSGTCSQAVSDRTVTYTWLGRSWGNDPKTMADFAGFILADEYMSDDSVNSAIQAMLAGKDYSTPGCLACPGDSFPIPGSEGCGEMCDNQVRYSPERWLGTWYYAEAVCRARGSSLMSSAKWVQGSPEAAADHLIYSQHGGHAEVWVGARQVWRHAHACDACQCKNRGDRCSFSHDNAVKNCNEGYEAHTTRVNGKMSMSRRVSSGGGQPQS